jgi:hypothetical protein
MPQIIESLDAIEILDQFVDWRQNVPLLSHASLLCIDEYFSEQKFESIAGFVSSSESWQAHHADNLSKFARPALENNPGAIPGPYLIDVRSKTVPQATDKLYYPSAVAFWARKRIIAPGVEMSRQCDPFFLGGVSPKKIVTTHEN